MANEKTILLSGIEQEVKISGQNCGIRNDGVDTVYISRNPNIVPDADGVLSVPAGQAAKYYDLNGFVYLLGTGKVQLNCNDYSTQDFRVAATSSGEGGADVEALKTAVSGLTETVAQNAEQLNAHAEDADIHLTAEKAIEAAATAISNPNLLINPHLAHPINQRGQTEYVLNNANVTVDGWRGIGGATITVSEDGVAVQGDGATNWAGIEQRIENPERFAGREFVFTACTIGTAGEKHNIIAATAYDGVDWRNDFISTGGEDIVTVSGVFPDDISKLRVVITSGNVANPTASLKPLWAKLELGTAATPFTQPDPAVELARCQRYLLDLFVNSAYRAVAINSNHIDFSIPTPTTMRPISGMSIINPVNLAVRAINSGTAEEGFSFAVGNYGRNQLRLRATKASHGLTDATLVVLGDSVLLSAEL